jgi:hypothetical protein
MGRCPTLLSNTWLDFWSGVLRKRITVVSLKKNEMLTALIQSNGRPVHGYPVANRPLEALPRRIGFRHYGSRGNS